MSDPRHPVRWLVLALVLLFTACSDLIEPDAAGVPGDGAIPFDGPPSAATLVTASIETAQHHTCMLRSTGVVWCWGANDYGEAPEGRAATLGHYVQLAAGSAHTCALRNDGVIECWGDNTWGPAPAEVSHPSGFTQLSTLGEHTCAVTGTGVIRCWGLNDEGQALDSVVTPGGFSAVAAGQWHTCGLRNDGVVDCWGLNNDDQAPDTVAAADSAGFVHVSAGSAHTCAVQANGVIRCWGFNFYMQAPASRSHAVGYTKVSAAYAHSCGLRTDGVVECWGDNDNDQTPDTVRAAVGRYTDVSASVWNYTCVLASTGTTDCFGSNNSGQAADGPTPTKPYNLNSYLAGDSAISTSWADSAYSERNFAIQRRAVDSLGVWGPWMYFSSTNRDVTGFVDYSVQHGGRYRYRVRACNAYDCSRWEAGPAVLVMVPPTAPESVGAVASSPNQNVLYWSSADSANTSTFRVLRREKIAGVWGSWRPFATYPGTDSLVIDSTAVSGAYYRYRVIACNAAGCAPFVQSGVIQAL